MKSVCLNMIVKNEAHVIRNTLENICQNIKLSYWVIVDTGSTDNTKQIILDFFKENNIIGELHDCEWVDFGYNRSFALQKAYKKTDYLFIFDADDKIEGKLNIPTNLTYDKYDLKFGSEFSYTRPLLINNDIKWYFKGVLHEYLTCDQQITNIILPGEYHIISGRTGNRSKNPNKYSDDAKVLEKAYYNAVETNDQIQYRYAFYCAQSYKDCGNIEKAIEWYKKRADNDKGWNQENYYSALMVGDLYKQLNDMKNALYYWNISINIDCERYEGIMNIIKYYREKNKFVLAYKYYQMLHKNPSTNGKLFIQTNDYIFQKYYEFSIIAYYVGKYEDAIDSFINLFKLKNKIDENTKKLIISNFLFYVKKITKKNRILRCEFSKFIENTEMTNTIEQILKLL